MKSSDHDRFVQLPAFLLDAIIQARLSGGQGRVLLWVLRYTYGWHGPRTLFTWYRIAHELGMDRAAVFRAGKRLLQANVLTCTDGQLAVNSDYGQWRNPLLERETVDGAQQWITEQIALPENSALVVGRQRKRCHGATLFRRTKDRCKDRKTVVVGARSVDNRNGERRIYEGADQRPTPVEQVMDQYIALQGKALTKNQTAAFYRHFRESAATLLEAYGGDVQAAKDALTRVGRRLDGRLTIPNVTS